MNFSKNNHSPDKWKNKYFSLLDEHHLLEKLAKDNEALLCKTIIRMSVAATGFSPELDPHYKRIRQQLKSGFNGEKLKQELEKFSSALMDVEGSADLNNKTEPALLIEFLIRHYPNRQIEIERICRQYGCGQKPKKRELLLALHELVDEEQMVVSEVHTHNVDDEAIKRQLISLLESTEIPEQFSGQAEHLKTRLQDANCDLPSILEEIFALWMLIKKLYQSEQVEMTKFLTNLTEQLLELGQQADGAVAASEQANKKRNLLDQSFSNQLTELQQGSNQATQLEPLKQLVSTGLAGITRQLQSYQQLEKQEREKHQQVTQALMEKIKQLEAEASELKNKIEIVHKEAIRDPLTGLPNRLAYDERLGLEMARRQRYGSPLSLIIWDIDCFKRINDNFGHKAGDKTLKIIAQLLEQSCRETDFISRFGGEEFTMLLPDTDAQSAIVIAEKLRRCIEHTGFNYGGNKISITISCGISEFTAEDSGDSVFKRADEALYKAKNNGRNQCIIA